MDSCQIVLCPCPDKAEAQRISEVLVDRGLAAAVNVVEQNSVYRWHGRTRYTQEFLLMIKSTEKSYTSIEQTILSMHSYELPGIAVVPVTKGFKPYLEWMRNGGMV